MGSVRSPFKHHLRQLRTNGRLDVANLHQGRSTKTIQGFVLSMLALDCTATKWPSALHVGLSGCPRVLEATRYCRVYDYSPKACAAKVKTKTPVIIAQ